jgi:predicted membrane protein
MAAKWEVLFAAIPISGAFLLAVWSSKGKIPYRRFFQLNFKRLLIIAFAAVLGFLVAVPDIYFVPDKIVDGLLFEAKHFQTGHYGEVLIEEKELGPCIWRRIEMLCAAGSIYWFIPGMLSLLCCIAKPRREHFLLVWSFIIWMLMLATNELAGERHHLTPFIFMVMMISVGLSIILEIKFRRASVLWSGLLAFLLVVELIYSCIFASPFWKPDARIECANWIKANVPLGSGVTWAPRTYNWMAPGKVVAPWLFQLYPRNPEQGKAQYIIAANAQMNIFKKHPPTRKIVPIEWFPTEPPTEDELRFYAEINAGGGPNLTLVKEFHTKPSFLGLDLRLFAMEPIQDTSSANRAVTLFRVNAPGTK